MNTKKIHIGGMSADAMLLTFTKFVTIVLSLLTTRLLTQYLSIYDYGTYSQILLIVSTISSVTMFGMMDGVNYFYTGNVSRDQSESYVATMFAMQGAFSLVAGCIVMVFRKSLGIYFDNENLSKLMIFAAILPFLQNILGMTQVLFVSIGKARLLAYRNLAVSLIKLLTVVVVILVVRNVVVVLVSALVLEIIKNSFFWIVLKKNNCQFRFNRINFRLMGDILRYCAPMASYLMISTLNRDMDKYLVSLMTDTETLALYANASKQLPFDIIMASFCTVLVPHITRCIGEKNNNRAAEIYKIFLEITYITTGILCCAALSVAPQLMKLLYSDKYINGLHIFGVYILVDLFRFTNISIVFSASGRTRQLLGIGIGSLVLNAILNGVLYNVMGLIGPAVATLITTLLIGAIMLVLNARIMEVSLLRLFDMRRLLVFGVGCAGLTLAMQRAQRFLVERGLHYCVILVIIAGTFGVVMLLLNGKRLLSNMKLINQISKRE